MGTLKRDLVIPYVNLNFGVQTRYPNLTLSVEEAEDTDMILRNANSLIAHGLRVKQSELRSKMGFSEPDKNDEVVGGTTPTQGTQEARNRAEGDDPYAELDDLQDDLSGDWEEVMGDTLEPMIALLETAGSYEEAFRIIADAFPQLGSKELIETLVKATVKARALGEAADG